MAKLSVSQAAERLGVNVQRVHQRIADGSLRAERVGHQWVIDDADLARLERRPAGRPLSPKSAWVLALLAEDHDLAALSSDVSASEKSRARARLREILKESIDHASSEDGSPNSPGVASLLRQFLGGRAERRSFRAARGDLHDLRSDHRLQVSGVSLPASGIASGDIVEGYVSEAALPGLVREFLLSEAGHAEANVVLHVVSPSVPKGWIHPDNYLVLAADLAEHHRPREARRAEQVVREAASMAAAGRR